MLYFFVMEDAGELAQGSHQEERERCPKCGSQDTRRSYTEGLPASLLRIFGRWPFRCRSCRSRFYRSSPPPEED